MLLILKLLQLHEARFLYHRVMIILKMFQVHHYEKVDFVDFAKIVLVEVEAHCYWMARVMVAQHYLMTRMVDFLLLFKGVFWIYLDILECLLLHGLAMLFL